MQVRSHDSRPAIDWEHTPGLLNRLRQLWDEGVTTRQIGVTLSQEFGLDVSKNAALGKAKRIGCPDRVVHRPAPRRQIATFDFDGPVCMWPIGHPGDENFHFCGSPHVTPRKPYCSNHAAIAYISPKQDGREKEAAD